MSKQLSYMQKLEYLPLLIKRDGFICIYCKQSLTYYSFIYEHLNNKRYDNRLENIALAHQSCNIRKAKFFDYQIIANEKLFENERKLFVREKILVEDLGAKEQSTEIEINQVNFAIVLQHLSECLQTNGSIEYSDALNSSVYLCKTKSGHGSQQSMRNYIATLTSSVGPFMIARDANKKKIILKRSGN